MNHRSTLITGVAVETRWAGAESMNRVAGATIKAGAAVFAAVTVETWEALCK